VDDVAEDPPTCHRRRAGGLPSANVIDEAEIDTSHLETQTGEPRRLRWRLVRCDAGANEGVGQPPLVYFAGGVPIERVVQSEQVPEQVDPMDQKVQQEVLLPLCVPARRSSGGCLADRRDQSLRIDDGLRQPTHGDLVLQRQSHLVGLKPLERPDTFGGAAPFVRGHGRSSRALGSSGLEHGAPQRLGGQGVEQLHKQRRSEIFRTRRAQGDVGESPQSMPENLYRQGLADDPRGQRRHAKQVCRENGGRQLKRHFLDAQAFDEVFGDRSRRRRGRQLKEACQLGDPGIKIEGIPDTRITPGAFCFQELDMQRPPRRRHRAIEDLDPWPCYQPDQVMEREELDLPGGDGCIQSTLGQLGRKCPATWSMEAEGRELRNHTPDDLRRKTVRISRHLPRQGQPLLRERPHCGGGTTDGGPEKSGWRDPSRRRA